ncbi:MT-A70 family methyltransferase [Methylobacterium flocculans]|uniref:MT-A70 family methyltransferase n=1 Tax=Methylobacterium flocculans TaxID=2984843 RepID=UPI0021F2A32C|nr:MT-A70 family methyltransferase [Methylobacterium sp. FF17]
MKAPVTFRPSELYRMGLALLADEQADARDRMAHGRKGRKVSGPSEVRDRIGARFGISGRQVDKIGHVCRAAVADPARFGPLLEEMDRTGKINGPYTKLLRLQDEARVLSLVPVQGRFRTLVFDPPWAEDNISDAAGHDYALMPFTDILAMPVRDWAEDDAHLYLWVTNNTILLAPQLLDAWGFEHKTVLTWTKPDIGFGRYFRNSTEHVIFATRGTLRTRPPARSTRTDHDWPVGANSEKPDAFYDLVRACSYPPFGEGFQRTPRPDFVNLYQPAPLPALQAAE